ncbi:MAG: LVIVD repeat-containing protein [Thermoplasmatota archaeon]
MRIPLLLAALLALGPLAGCLDDDGADNAQAQDQARIDALPWEDLGNLAYDAEHEHNLRDLHTELNRGVEPLAYSPFSDDGLSLGEYTELDNEQGLIAMAVVTGDAGVDLRIVLLDAAALPAMKVVGTIDEPNAYGDVKIDEELPLLYIPYPGARFTSTQPGSGLGFSIWDISDPAEPVRVGQAPGGGCHMLNTLRVEGQTYVWCASVTGPTTYRIESLPTGQYAGVPISSAIPQSDPEVLRYADYYAALTATGFALLLAPHDMTAQLDPLTGAPILVVADEINGIRVFDVAQPAAPVQLGYWRGESAEAPIERVHTALVTDIGGKRIAFGATETLFDVPPQMYIVDMTDYADPIYLGTWIPPGIPTDDGLAYSLHNFQVVGTRLYMANFHAGLWVLDVSDPSNPFPVALRTPVRECGYPRPEESVAGHPIDANQYWDPIVVNGYVLMTDIPCGVEVLHVDGDPAGDPAYTSFA